MDGRRFGNGKRTGSVPHRGHRYCVFSGSPPASGNATHAGVAGCDFGLDYGLRAVPGVAAFGCVSESEGRDTVVWGGQLSRSGPVLPGLAALVSAARDVADCGDSCGVTAAGGGEVDPARGSGRDWDGRDSRGYRDSYGAAVA